MITLPCPGFAGLQKGCEWFAKGQRKGGFEGPWLWTILYIYMCYTHNIQSTCVRVHMYVCVYVYIYIYLGRACLVAPMFLLIRMRSVFIQLNTNVIRGPVKRAQLLEHVRNFCETRDCWETCTTSLTRAQHLWNVHNIFETCTTTLKRADIEYFKTLGGGAETPYTHMCIYNYIYIYIYMYR